MISCQSVLVEFNKAVKLNCNLVYSSIGLLKTLQVTGKSSVCIHAILRWFSSASSYASVTWEMKSVARKIGSKDPLKTCTKIKLIRFVILLLQVSNLLFALPVWAAFASLVTLVYLHHGFSLFCFPVLPLVPPWVGEMSDPWVELCCWLGLNPSSEVLSFPEEEGTAPHLPKKKHQSKTKTQPKPPSHKSNK